MGWLFSARWGAKKDLVAHLRGPECFAQGNLVASSVIGNNHWYLAKAKDQTIYIGLDLMKFVDGEGGYKSLDETCGPNEVNCPLSYLDKASPCTNKYAIEWRERVRQYHRIKKDMPEPKVGMLLYYGNTLYELLAPLGRKGWGVVRKSDGATFRMPCRQINEALKKLVPQP